jgi:hypothetical protein
MRVPLVPDDAASVMHDILVVLDCPACGAPCIVRREQRWARCAWCRETVLETVAFL